MPPVITQRLGRRGDAATMWERFWGRASRGRRLRTDARFRDAAHRTPSGSRGGLVATPLRLDPAQRQIVAGARERVPTVVLKWGIVAISAARRQGSLVHFS